MARNLLLEEILGAEDFRTVDIEVPEWGTDCVVSVKVMSGEERDTWETAYSKESKNPSGSFSKSKCLLLAFTLVDGDGERICDGLAAAEKLNQKNSRAVNRLFDAASDLNGLSNTSKKETEKNLGAVGSGNSGTSSPDSSESPEE